MQMIDGFPRRNRMDHLTPAETAIRAAMAAVEEAGAHVLLTDAVVLLGQAADKVADFVELRQEASPEAPLSFKGAMRQADEAGLVTESMRAEWDTDEYPLGQV